jgi:hypothetical protein
MMDRISVRLLCFALQVLFTLSFYFVSLTQKKKSNIHRLVLVIDAAETDGSRIDIGLAHVPAGLSMGI